MRHALPADLRGFAHHGGSVAQHSVDWHRHRRGQLLYAAKGVVAVRTPQGAWVAPPERAVWIPGGVPHSVKMVGAVSTRSVLIEPEVWRSAGDRCLVVEVSALLRSLLVAAGAIEPEYAVDGRDGMVMGLLLAELARAPQIPLAYRFRHVRIWPHTVTSFWNSRTRTTPSTSGVANWAWAGVLLRARFGAKRA